MNARTAAAGPAVKTVCIDEEQAGQRIDNFLVRILKGVPRSRIYRILRRGEVRVNRGRIRPTYRLQVGDEVRSPPVRMGTPSATQLSSADFSWLEQRILYEDERLLALDKPAGMAVHSGSGISVGIIEALRALRPGARFLELVHRLDRDTSGCLLIAKRRSQLRSLHELLREGHVHKRYLALTRGAWRGGPREISAGLATDRSRGNERMVEVDDEGKASHTLFRPVEVFAQASLLDAEPATGRTHQIRVHAAHGGFPLAGDEKYGDPDFNAKARDWGLRRLFLHAHLLEFDDPQDGRQVTIHAPLAQDLAKVVDVLQTGDSGNAI